MTASVKYWRLPEEERDFVSFVDSIEPAVALAPRTVAKPEQLEWKPLANAFASEEGRYLITLERLLPQIRILETTGTEGPGYKVDVVASPVLMYYRGRMIAPNRLVSSSLSADWQFLGEDGGSMQDQPADFIRWATRVMQWVRNVAPGWYQHNAHRITAKAEAARQSGLELVS